MKTLFTWIIGLGVIVAAAYWLHTHDLQGRAYAPAGAQDTELAKADVAEPPPPLEPAPVAVKANLATDAPPRTPVDYSQIRKDARDAPPPEQPANKSDEKSVFY